MKKDFLHITDFSADEIQSLFDLARKLKKELKEGISHQYLKGKTLTMIFQKPSARTRVSFEIAMWQLGGYALYLGPTDIQLGTRESIPDLARVLSRYNDLLMARVFEHSDLLDISKFADVPVINGLSDFNHPCQVMADIFTLLERRGSVDNLKVAFVGDGNNVCHSWLELCERVPIQLVISCPEGYEPDRKVFEKSRKKGLSDVSINSDPLEAVKKADMIYTDVWTSMGKEQEAKARRKFFLPYQVNGKLMKRAGKKAYFMHCLPAHRGEEVTDEVLDSPQSIVFDQAENRLHIQKAIMVTLLRNSLLEKSPF